jgi:hypothetical protein
MARELDCGRSTVQDAIEQLIETGWVEKKANGRGGRAPVEGEQPFAAYSYRVVLDRDDLPQRLSGEDQMQESSPEGAASPAGGATIPAPGAASGPAPLEGESSKGISSEPERENARAREHEKFAKWLAAFTLRWPTAAADDQTRIANAGRGLTEDERDAALERIPAFLGHLKQHNRKHVPAGWNYLEQKRFNLIEPEKPKAEAPQIFQIHEGTPLFQIWNAVFRIAKAGRGFPDFMVQGQTPHRVLNVRKELPEALIGIAAADCEWRTVIEGQEPRGQFAAWWRWLTDIVPASHVSSSEIAGRRSLTVPLAWPPRKDGSIGPPQEKTETDAA